jgi:hypothetical protein
VLDLHANDLVRRRAVRQSLRNMER